jgi:hypothetical protein
MGTIRGGILGFHGTIGQPTAQVIDGSLKIDAGSSQYLGRTPGSVGNRRTWTASFWTKSNPSGSTKQTFFQCRVNNNSDDTGIGLENDKIRVVTGTVDAYITSRVLRDPCAWYHIVVVFDTTQSTDSNRVKVYVNSELDTGGTTSYPSTNTEWSINTTNLHAIGRHEGVDSQYLDAYLSQFYFIDGQALGPEYFGFTDPLTNTWRPKKAKTDGPNVGTTWSSVSTISSGGAASGKPLSNGFDGSTGTAFEGDTSGATVTVPVSATIVKGGVKVYAAVTSGNPLVVLLKNGGTTVETINAGASGGQFYSSSTYSGPITSLVISRTGRAPEFNAIGINGIILKDDSTTNLAFGTNGFYLPMDNQDDFEEDKSGEGNDWTKNNFSGTSINPDVLKDSPSGAVFGGPPTSGITTTSSAPSNYATLNPLDTRGLSNSPNFSEGNLRIGDSSSYDITSTIGADSGKWYWEIEMIDVGTTICGIVDIHNGRSSQFSMSNPTVYYATTRMNGTREGNQSGGTNFTYTDGDIVAWALDVDNLKLYGYKNGSLQSTATITPTDITWSPYVYGESTTDHRFNFGQKPFKYAPPQGYLPLNSASVRPNKVVPRPDQYVGVATYTSGDGSAVSIDSYNFSPDLIFIKDRDASNNWSVFDKVRGSGNRLDTSGNGQEQDWSAYFGSFDKNGFTVTNQTSDLNRNTNKICSWGWKAGGNKNTFNVDDEGYATAAAAGLNSGSITPTGASVGTKQGFSIISYTGTGSAGTLSHGLLKAPDLIIMKGRNFSDDWRVYHKDLDATEPEDYYLILQSQNGKSADQNASFMNDTAPTNTVFSLGTDSAINGSTRTMIAYCWHDISGLQKFGKYTGSGQPFIELGFRPAILIIKSLTGSRNWVILDSNRSKFNPSRRALLWNDSSNEDNNSVYDIDFLSNGFKIRGSNSQIKGDNNYVYMAWAEAPAYNLFGGQSNAR